jgi:type VI secretion system protein ImpM
MPEHVSAAAVTAGLFGKLPAKRDFVAVNVPAAVLRPLETWLQTGIAASRQSMGAAWQAAFLQAPLWRFWLGQRICGLAVMGAMMPSMDGVGRYFPLVLLAMAPPGRSFPTPIAAMQDGPLAAAEDFLLATLEGDTPYEALLERMQALPLPVDEPASDPARWMEASGRLVASVAADAEGLAAALATVRTARTATTLEESSFWWTLGGEGLPPQAFACPGFPDHATFGLFLTGQAADTTARGDEQ